MRRTRSAGFSRSEGEHSIAPCNRRRVRDVRRTVVVVAAHVVNRRGVSDVSHPPAAYRGTGRVAARMRLELPTPQVDQRRQPGEESEAKAQDRSDCGPPEIEDDAATASVGSAGRLISKLPVTKARPEARSRTFGRPNSPLNLTVRRERELANRLVEFRRPAG